MHSCVFTLRDKIHLIHLNFPFSALLLLFFILYFFTKGQNEVKQNKFKCSVIGSEKQCVYFYVTYD